MMLRFALSALTALSLAFVSSATLASPNAGHSADGTPADADQQVKCRKVQVTGSLIRKGKVCRTVAEWKRLQQLGNDAARAIAGEHVCAGGECRGFEPPPNGQ